MLLTGSFDNDADEDGVLLRIHCSHLRYSRAAPQQRLREACIQHTSIMNEM